MRKSICLKVKTIRYGGDSVGRDIRVEIKVFNKSFRIDKRIKIGEIKDINQEIERIETDKKLLESDISITVIEKDLLFSDTGNTKGNIKIDTASTKSQSFMFEVEIKESRPFLSKLFWGRRSAVFEIELEAQSGEIERFTPDIENGDGWIVTKNNKGESISLPAYVKVVPKYIKGGREYFVPLEGTHRDELLSVPQQDSNSSYLISGVQHAPMVKVTYSISKKIFVLNGKQYKATDDPDAPWKKGVYNIGIPDFPHGRNDRYAEAIRQKIWFPINFESARYLHVGAHSLGCMTIIETTRWMEIYNSLIKARKGDLKNVGVVEVID